MPTVKKSLAMREQFPEGVTQFLLTGEVAHGDVEAYLFSRDRSAVRRAWKSVREELLTEYIQEHPGRRPWAFWKFDLSEPRRRRTGGTGDLVPAYNCGANVDFGIFRKCSFVDDALISAWRRINCLGEKKLIPIDENDLPTYESQAAFLKRYSLFLPGEESRLTPADFADEVVR